MREIKFRAWSYENSKMIEVGQLEFFTGGEIHINEELPSHFQGKKLYELMQYTGLKDKNGKEIYEGDIVKHQQLLGGSLSPSKPENCEIKYKDCAFGAYIINPKWVDEQVYMHSEKLEIIGNIYENPELIK